MLVSVFIFFQTVFAKFNQYCIRLTVLLIWSIKEPIIQNQSNIKVLHTFFDVRSNYNFIIFNQKMLLCVTFMAIVIITIRLNQSMLSYTHNIVKVKARRRNPTCQENHSTIKEHHLNWATHPFVNSTSFVALHLSWFYFFRHIVLIMITLWLDCQ